MNARADLPLGLVYDLPLDDYLAVDAVSSTDLRLLSRSPWHYRNRIEVAQTRSMLRGTLAHCAVLEPDAMAQRFVVVPEDAPRMPSKSQWAAKKPSADSQAAMAWWTIFQEANAGRDLVSREDYAVCQQQLDAVRQQPRLAELLRAGRGEVSVFWIDEATGIYCKARPDWLPLGDLAASPLDLKTCVDESPSGFGRAAARLRYDLQAAHYTAGIEAVTRVKVDAFVFGAVTNKPPVLAVPYVLTDEIRDQGREERRELMERLVWCRRENEWPAYGAGVQLLDFPAYAKQSGEVEVEWSSDTQESP
ncbi:PD-(D/E)XK nuclease-like domain-containing protein [Methylibium sp. Pch-M]|uniref:PD-(D/E)XK nuclease-like domain-containing protein n=1 Tax=Methylibium sp. Pch-M TaxID=2082386 RepID=UPI0013EB2472|nr:PD-(D/E)XK nuclease-like domain-containing protein [Methylibium sp. Pch-M]